VAEAKATAERLSNERAARAEKIRLLQEELQAETAALHVL
jgi:hypothetical protein